MADLAKLLGLVTNGHYDPTKTFSYNFTPTTECRLCRENWAAANKFVAEHGPLKLEFDNDGSLISHDLDKLRDVVPHFDHECGSGFDFPAARWDW